ncbi:MAG: GNAT family N-acetyltransferase [Saprospiraceae bacterium]|nr:GNAT family N-acetyltransferase [Pyrinomonadaceae bacterium]
MQNFRIRIMLPDDLTDILQISDECGLSHWSRQDYLDEATRTDSIMLCAECDEFEVAAFLVSRTVLSAGAKNCLDAELYNIGVRPELQNQGCGTMLIAKFLENCGELSVENIWLDVRSSNSNAINFYKCFGFREFALRKNFYSDPAEDGIIMKVVL